MNQCHHDQAFLSVFQTFIDEFWLLVDKTSDENGCWIWRGQTQGKSGYGIYYRWPAHRLSWMLTRGMIPRKMVVRHRVCDNPPCVNPDHLRLGTHRENMEDMVEKGRQARGDRSGSRLHPERLPRGDQHYARSQPNRLARGDRHGSKTMPHRVERGSAKTMAKLTDDQVMEIRVAYAGGGVSQSQLATQYSVSRSLISRVISGKRWRHIDEKVNEALHDKRIVVGEVLDGQAVILDEQEVSAHALRDVLARAYSKRSKTRRLSA